MKMENVEIYGNESDLGGGIYLLCDNDEPVTITDSMIGSENPNGGNIAHMNGGGLYVETHQNPVSAANVTLNGTYVQRNVAEGDGGGIYMQNVDTEHSVDHLALRDSLISGNQSGGSGGGVFFQSVGGTLEPYGDPVDGAALVIARTTIDSNTATASGGGVYASFSFASIPPHEPFTTLLVRDSTISGNTAYGGTGGIEGSAGGGGIFLSAIDPYYNTITNSTISGNRALNGGGVYLTMPSGRSKTLFRHTTISNNTAGPFDGDMDAPIETQQPQYTAGGGILITGATTPPVPIAFVRSYDYRW